MKKMLKNLFKDNNLIKMQIGHKKYQMKLLKKNLKKLYKIECFVYLVKIIQIKYKLKKIFYQAYQKK